MQVTAVRCTNNDKEAVCKVSIVLSLQVWLYCTPLTQSSREFSRIEVKLFVFQVFEKKFHFIRNLKRLRKRVAGQISYGA